jgi:hypothetical protein
MNLVTESVAGGLVTVRDETTLEDGELTRADEAFYKDNSGAAHPFPNRVAYNTTPLSGNVGIIYAERRVFNDVIVTHGAGTLLFSYTAGEAGEFTAVPETGSFAQIAQGTTLDSAQIGDAVIIVNGANAAVMAHGTDVGVGDPFAIGLRPAGYSPVTVAPTHVNNGTWDGSTGNYWWWSTENDVFVANSFPGNQSGFSGTPVAIDRTNAGAGLRFTNPAATNPSATQWRLWRSVATSTTAPPIPSFENPFPIGFLVGTANIGSTIDDTGIQDLTTPFPALTVAIAGTAVSVAQNGTPPTNPSTCDVLENSIVVNDSNRPSIIRYTFPDSLASWPDIYFINIETKGQDDVVKIRRVQNVLVVAMREQLARINYLPRENDAEFDRGRAWDLISPNHGIVGPHAADLVAFDGRDSEPVLAFLSRSGLYFTDGYQVTPLQSDVDIIGLISGGRLDKTVLVNVPHLNVILIGYTPLGGQTNTKVLVLHYHSSHRKDGGLKVSGPISMEMGSAAYVHPTTFTPTLFTTASNGIVNLEDRGPAPREMVLRTRMHLNGGSPVDTISIERLYIRHRGALEDGEVQVISQTPEEPDEEEPMRAFSTTIPGFSEIAARRSASAYALKINSLAPIEYWTAETVPEESD